MVDRWLKYFTLLAVVLVLILGLVYLRETSPAWKEGAKPAAGKEGAALSARGESLFTARTCDSCHRINGKGGNSAPDLSAVGARRDADWLKKWLRDPAAVKPGTAMPRLPLSTGDIEALATYLSGLRGVPGGVLPLIIPLLPGDTPVERGEKLYAMHCASCHGVKGEGRRVANAPALRNKGLMEAATDKFLQDTISLGRPGTLMKAFAQEAGGNLSAQDISHLVAFLRGWPTGEEKDLEAVLRGGATFAVACSSCHGRNGEGGLGTALNNRFFLRLVPDEFLRRTILEGRPGTPMKGFRDRPEGEIRLSPEQVEGIIKFLRSWEEPEPREAQP